MDYRRGSLFSIDIRIDTNIIKLKVYDQDNLNDLVDRLFPSVTPKSTSKEKLTAKLESQFKKILIKKEISDTVKQKLQSLLEESKLVIVAIDTDKNEPELNETPFKILQESSINGRKPSTSKIKKNFQYIDEASLNVKYQSQDIGTQRSQIQLTGEPCFENLMIRTKNDNIRPGDEGIGAFRNRQDVMERSPIFKRKYANQADVSRQKHITHFQPNPNYYQASKRHELGQLNGGYQPFLRMKDEKIHEYPLRPINSNRMHQEMSSNQTYQQYKANSFKNPTFAKAQIQREQNYYPLSSRQNIKPSKSYTKLNYCNENNGATIRNYDKLNACQTKRNYDSAVDTKKLSEAVSYKRLKGKFNYLGQ